MRTRLTIAACTAAFALVAPVAATAADSTDPKAAREHEMLRRTQEALRETQAQNAELTAQKTRAEQEAQAKLKSAAAEIDSVRNAARSSQASLRAELDRAGEAQAGLNRQLAEAKQQLAALTAQQEHTAGELKQAQQDLAASKTRNASCEAKNLKLYEYSEELMQRYRKKGVWAALGQKEPLTGIKEVGIENVLQEYREKLDAQKIPQSAQP